MEKGISPVHQDVSDMARHLAQREMLYRSLGLAPVAFRERDILEIGPGSGHNSLFITAQMPCTYDLVEPNPVAVAEMEALYGAFDLPHSEPAIIPKRLEDFDPRRSYDIAICEGWLGSNEEERALLRKLSGFVSPGGVLVISFLPTVGAVPSLLRRLLAYRILPDGNDFEAQTGFLTAAFGPHLEPFDTCPAPTPTGFRTTS